jgi:hypothetical protein
VVGMLAGGGLLSICFARGARAHGLRIVAIALKGDAGPELAQYVDEIHWTNVAKLGRWIRIFKRAGVQHAVMCGSIRKPNMYRHPVSFFPDLRSAKMWYSRMLRSREDHTVLQYLAEEFETEGIRIESSVLYCPELLAPGGCLTARRPTEREWADIRFGWPLAKQIAALQIGQMIVVKDRAVVAVESIDGTNATLRRGGRLASGHAVAVKVAKEGHDPRFDVPCVGPDTVDVLREARVPVLAVEAGQVIVLEREEVARRARAARVTVIAIAPEDCAGP